MAHSIDSSSQPSNSGYLQYFREQLTSAATKVMQFAKHIFPFLLYLSVPVYLSVKCDDWTRKQLGEYSTGIAALSISIYVGISIVKWIMKEDSSSSSDTTPYGEKLVEKYRKTPPESNFFRRDEEIRRLVAALMTKQTPNAFLIGPAGCGKSDIVDCLAKLIALKDSLLPKEIHEYEILSMTVKDITSGTIYRGSLEQRVNNLLRYLKDHPKTFLFVDEAQSMFAKQGTDEQTHVIPDLLKVELINQLRMICACTQDDFETSIQSDSAFTRRFTPVRISSMTPETTLKLLKECKKKNFENVYNVSISNEILAYIIELTKTTPLAYPAKATHLLHNACSWTKLDNRKTVEKKDVKAAYGNLIKKTSEVNPLYS